MSGSKVSKTEVKNAADAAASMAHVFRDASMIAVERELDYINTELRKNVPLMYALSGFLKDDSLVALLEGRMGNTVAAADVASSRASGKGAFGVLRLSWKKWAHIQRETKLIILLLRISCNFP